MRRRTRIAMLLGAAAVLTAAIAAPRLIRAHDTGTDDVADNRLHAAGPAALDAAAVERGRRVAVAADCAACHTSAQGAAPYAGGYTLHTPFGDIVSSNITPDRTTGIGDWTERDFFRAVRHGQAPRGLLYPAMPYPSYVQISDRDMHDLWSYFRSLKPIKANTGGTRLPFPFNIRQAVAGWNMLYFDNRPFKLDNSRSDAWNRGRYLTDALGHCAACHTPKNFLGGDKGGEYLRGGTLQGWHAPDITNDGYRGLGSWSEPDIVSYLREGSNSHAVAAGPMAEAVELSTQYMPDADLAAMATYLKSLPAEERTRPSPVAASEPAMVRGRNLYGATCSACHGSGGQGIPGMATRLSDNPSIRAGDAASLMHVVLVGGRAARTKANPTGAGMPAYDWKMTDADIAAVLTYVRNSWGNAAPAVSPGEVGAARKDLGARPPL